MRLAAQRSFTAGHLAVERLRLTLLATVAGTSLLTACYGRSARQELTSGKAGGAGDAGSSGRGGSGSSSGSDSVLGIECGSPTPYGELERCDGPFFHRPSVTSCAVPDRYGPGEAGAGGISGGNEVYPNECETDFDCDAKPHGFCTVTNDFSEHNVCTYACGGDGDCSATELCSCSDSYVHAGRNEEIALGVCQEATCKEDADCAVGQLCIASPTFNCWWNHPGPFHCQSTADECSGRDDCDATKDCVHDGTNFVCKQLTMCGRPFVVHGAARVAALASAAGWTESSLAARDTELPDVLRAEIARHYLETGLMEHASVAAFARFSLQLLALGAPADLVEASTRAMQDEIRHAKLCFGLAARYGASAGPGTLDLRGALEDPDLKRVVDFAVVEGCIGETCAALEAGWAADAAIDPVVRETLSGIAEDEAKHAALAFRFVAWAAERDAGVGPVLERRVIEALEACSVPSEDGARVSPHRDALGAHGVLDASSRAAARNAALSEIVLPAMRALLASRRTARNLNQETLSC